MSIQNDNSVRTGIEVYALSPQQWVGNYADYLYSYAITRIHDEDQAKDLVQETFLAALERLDRFEGRSSERTWLTAILKNKIIDVYRKKSSGLNRVVNSDTERPDQDDFFDAEDGHWKVQHQPKAFGIEEYDPLNRKEFNYILQKCLQKLPVLWLSVFTMKHIDDAATEFICSELKVTNSNFWVIIHRTKVNLRSCLQKNWI
jgi:RNA polymerase sigma-70 factor (TIGR02943 family)